MKRLLLMLLFAAGLVVASQSAASAADFTVNSNADAADASPGNGVCATAGGTCTLRAAVMESESLSGADSITVPAMTISLGSPLTITKTVTIRGAGARSTIVTGTPNHILFSLTGGDIVLRDFSLQGATATNGSGLAIQQTSNAATQLIGVRVADNRSTNGVSNLYGAIYVTAGEMEIRNSSITGNATTSSGQVVGGGVFVTGASTRLLVENSTVHGNTVTTTSSNSFGGGIASINGAVTTIRSSTITNNSALNTASISGTGGNLYRESPMTVENSIVAGGVAAFSTYANCFSGITFTGRNIVSDTTCGAAGATRVIADPQLGALSDNGGGTDSRAPAVGSPAINAAPACVTAADQRGQGRPLGAACDIGAVELGSDLALTAAVSNPSPTPGSDVVFTLVVANAGADAAAGTTVSIDVTGAPQITSASSSLGSCSVAGSVITCNLGTVNRGAQANVLIVARVPDSGTVASSATVSSSLPDPNPSNNSASASASAAASVPGAAPGTSEGRCKNVIRGNARANRLRGTSAGDKMLGRGGKDVLRSFGGADCLSGGRGNDRLVSGSGDDRLVGGKGRDSMASGSGADDVRARDGARDFVKCGAGRDTVVADKVDRIAKDCEKVRRK
jgi:CSLREA domain-containing protein